MSTLPTTPDGDQLLAVSDEALPQVYGYLFHRCRDRWPDQLDRLTAERTLAMLSPPQRLVLTLRYVDDLPVADVAELLDRSVAATESLLTRARAAFRREYVDPRPVEGGAS